MKKRIRLMPAFALLIISTLLINAGLSQSPEGAARVSDVSNRYRTITNVTYLTATNFETPSSTTLIRTRSLSRGIQPAGISR